MKIRVDITDKMSFLCVKINENIYDDYFKVNEIYTLEEIQYVIHNSENSNELWICDSDESSVKKQYGGATLSICDSADELIIFVPTGITQELIWNDICKELMFL